MLTGFRAPSLPRTMLSKTAGRPSERCSSSSHLWTRVGLSKHVVTSLHNFSSNMGKPDQGE